jgi:hypothetical protein
MKIHLATLLALLAVLLMALECVAAERAVAQGMPPEMHQHEIYEEGPGPDAYFDDCPTCHSADCCCDIGRWAAGFAFVIVQPHREDDLAFLSIVDSGTSSTTTDTNFENDTELSPRVWLEYNRGSGLGARVTYWQYDHGSPERSGSPADTGFETIVAPTFGDVEIATNVPGEVYTAVADIDLDVVDLEGTKWTQFECWEFGASGGLRFASVQQGYRGALFDEDGMALAGVDSSHRFDGVGPTFSIEGRRPFGVLTFFSMARGSLLFGNGRSGFTAVEGLGGTTAPFVTRTELERNDVLSVGEIQVGLEWRKYCCNGNWFFCRTAIEGQVWQGAGSARSEDGDLGFFGLNVAFGMTL